MQSAQMKIRDAATARLLLEKGRVRLLEPFIQDPQTIAGAATKLGVKAPLLHYHVNQFLERGLLEIAGTERRNGRTVKLYRTVARAYFIPFELTSSTTLEGLLAELAAPSHTNFLHANARVLEELAPDWGFRWSHNGEGAFYYEMLPENSSKEAFEKQITASDGPVVISFHDSLTLEHETAKALQRDLVELAERYSALQTQKGQRYSIRVGLVPTPNH